MAGNQRPAFSPTRREILIVIVLTITFTLYLQSGNHETNTWRDKLAQAPAGPTKTVVPVVPEVRPVITPERPKGGSKSGAGREPELTVGSGRLEWGTHVVPETRLVGHAPGWTVFEKLYVMNGTVFIVTDQPAKFPAIRMMTSTGYRVENPPEEVAKREPTDKDMRIVSTTEAARLFGKFAGRLDGVNFIANEPVQFVAHYYHFSAELLFGLWRSYSSLDPSISSSGKTSLRTPRRLIFPHVATDKWRDYASTSQFVLYGAFPSISLEFSRDWQDRADLARPFVLDTAVLGDRAAAMRGPVFLKTGRIASEAFALPGSTHWWAPIRNGVVTSAGFGGVVKGPPVITYVSRQEWGRRMLKQADHERLVTALHRLRDRYGYEVNIVSLDKLSRDAQIKLAARTTIMLGLHGNGLTHLIWMQPNPRSTVIEIFYPGGFLHDYEYITRAMGMTHFGFWDAKSFTSPDVPPVSLPEGFQGNEIPVDGDAVAALIHRRLSLDEEMDD